MKRKLTEEQGPNKERKIEILLDTLWNTYVSQEKRGDYNGAMASLEKLLTKDYPEALKRYRRPMPGTINFEDSPSRFDTPQQAGLAYYLGLGLPQSFQKAAAQYQIAAKQGNVLAQINLANQYMQGSGVEKDPLQAFSWFQAAAAQGSASAQHSVACFYGSGIGTEKDLKKSVEYLEKSADQGYGAAKLSFANCNFFGYGTEKNLKKAFELYNELAEMGDVKALYNAAFCFYHGYGTEKDSKKAFEFYKKLAEKGIITAKYQLALCYKNGNDTAQPRNNPLFVFKSEAEKSLLNNEFAEHHDHPNRKTVDEYSREFICWCKKEAEEDNKFVLELLTVIRNPELPHLPHPLSEYINAWVQKDSKPLATLILSKKECEYEFFDHDLMRIDGYYKDRNRLVEFINYLLTGKGCNDQNGKGIFPITHRDIEERHTFLARCIVRLNRKMKDESKNPYQSLFLRQLLEHIDCEYVLAPYHQLVVPLCNDYKERKFKMEVQENPETGRLFMFFKFNLENKGLVPVELAQEIVTLGLLPVAQKTFLSQ